MADPFLSVREIQSADVDMIATYWLTADQAHLQTMGVDIKKMMTREQFSENLLNQMRLPITERISYCVIWLLDGSPVGHSNTNPTSFGNEAKMHLHLWNGPVRKKGLGTGFVKKTLPLFFENLQLEKLICEPYALNPAPNKTLEKVGFEFIKEYITTPGYINFEQPVKRWELTYKKFKDLNIEPA